jgi:hypothetical protein
MISRARDSIARRSGIAIVPILGTPLRRPSGEPIS